MAEINGEVYLIMLRNIVDTLLVLHVDCYELVTYLGRVFRIVLLAKLFRRDRHLQIWLVFQFYSFALYLLTPAIFVQTLSEENHVK
jgi:hypothetical protein